VIQQRLLRGNGIGDVTQFGIIREAVFGDVAVVSVACPAIREDDVAAFVGVGREKKYQIGQLWIGSKSEFPHFSNCAIAFFPTASEPV
jgi:hypothetical protein